MGSIGAAYDHAPCGWLGICTCVQGRHEIVCGGQVGSTEDFSRVLIDVSVTEFEAGAKCVSFVHGEWVCKCDSFVRAMVIDKHLSYE